MRAAQSESPAVQEAEMGVAAAAMARVAAEMVTVDTEARH